MKKGIMQWMKLIFGIIFMSGIILGFSGCGGTSGSSKDTLTLSFNEDPVGDLNPHMYLPASSLRKIWFMKDWFIMVKMGKSNHHWQKVGTFPKMVGHILFI